MLEVPLTDGAIAVRVPTAADLVAADGGGDPQCALVELLDRVAVAGGDGPYRPVGELDLDGIQRIGAALAAIDPQADTTLELGCPDCGHAFSVPFDPAEFLWGELSEWAVRLLGDVHALALAYGWREEDTLALSPARRRFYLEAIGA